MRAAFAKVSFLIISRPVVLLCTSNIHPRPLRDGEAQLKTSGSGQAQCTVQTFTAPGLHAPELGNFPRAAAGEDPARRGREGDVILPTVVYCQDRARDCFWFYHPSRADARQISGGGSTLNRDQGNGRLAPAQDARGRGAKAVRYKCFQKTRAR